MRRSKGSWGLAGASGTMLKQLSSRLAPRLFQGELAAFHTSAAAYGVGIPERKHSQGFIGLHEGE